MKILTVDIGTGTQDVFLYDSRLDIENGFKLVLPSPTMMVHRRIKEATRRGDPVLLAGVTMGGGPSSWAVEAHLKAGYAVYATPEAAQTLDDDLEHVRDLGVVLLSEEEARALPDSVRRIEFRDFDFPALAEVFERFGVPLDDLAAVAVAVFDHGAAPPGVSDRQFRFDYLDRRIRQENRLSAFAYRAENVPAIMTRLQAVVDSARGVDVPLVVMDTAPAAVLGATFDPRVAARERVLIANVGNFHTLAFRLGPEGVEGVFEHHTGLVDRPKLESLLRALADGSLTHEAVFGDHGHGALVYAKRPLSLGEGEFDVVVTGPRRNLLRPQGKGGLRPYFAVPFGDMMLAGCFGLLAAVADLLPEVADVVRASLQGAGGAGTPPWEAVD
ncbi:MAG: pyruvate formate lyase-activating protein [Anaerolineae bacterium]|nr:MAG: pyruvate formate lyase-activating protein [Anaerolineae bacterium]